MRLVAVGTGTVIPEGDRGGSCFYLEERGSKVLVDCGPGAVQGLARLGLPWRDVTDLILTHFHVDHIGAVPGLFFSLKHGLDAPRERPLTVWGPPGTRRLFSRLAAAVGDFVVDPGFAVHIQEYGRASFELGGDLELSVHPTAHTEESHAVRITGGRTAIAYTGDTGLPEGETRTLGAFLAGVDVLIAECSLADADVGANHLSPRRLAALAGMARPDLLWVTHVYPRFRMDHDVAGLLAAAGYGGEVWVVADGDGWSSEP